MTDEERQKLCARLRTEGTGTYQAADEIERLAKERDAWRKRAEDKDNEIVMALGGREHPSRR